MRNLSTTMDSFIIYLNRKIEKRIYKRRMSIKFKTLTKEEKNILTKLYFSNDTLLLHPDSKAVKRLLRFKMIGLFGKMHMVDNFNPSFPYYLEDWVKDYINNDSVLKKKLKSA